ncbi:MAG: NUDIX domain-containing protein [Verrucomicrobiota bacterium]
MNYLLTGLLSVSLVYSVWAGNPAGIVLYFEDGQDVFFLLADDADGVRGWGAYGGGSEEGESVMETAARETEEETRGYFRREWLLEKLRGQRPVKSANGFRMFFVEVPFVPAQRVMQNPLEDEANPVFRERAHYAWIPESDLKRALEDGSTDIDPLYLPSSCEVKSYWDVWLDNMADAYRRNACPWQVTGNERH